MLSFHCLLRPRLFPRSVHLLQNYLFSLLFTQKLSKVILAYLAGRHASFNINSPCDSPFPSNLCSNTWGYKEKYGCLQSDFALGSGTNNWSQAHTPPIRGAHPVGSRNCHAADSWHTLPLPSTRSQKAPSLVTLTLLTCLGLSSRPTKLFTPS